MSSKRKVHEAAVIAAGCRNPALIERRERDYGLRLHSSEWGRDLNKSWQESESPERHFVRRIQVKGESDEIEERIVRFPSAPIYGTNRKRDYNIEFKERANMHTLRVLKRPGREPIDRLFVLNNGLNETGNLRFYYLLANWILSEDKSEHGKQNSAFLIVPFPGHLMHAPFAGPFSQTPLSRYLSDSGELFRQFLRYMVEMRWLLGAITRRRPAEWTVGPLAARAGLLAGEVLDEWAQLRRASGKRLADRDPKSGEPLPLDEEDELRLLGVPLDDTAVTGMIDVLKAVLGRDARGKGPDSLPVHVVGYSLGGFLAQCVFFAWPNMVSSCATICSGGAIRALSPTAFAHPEEWQAVLHTLRPELEESMLRGRISRDGDRIAGLADDQFCYYQRIFDQVFLQEDKASYKARVSEYATRMLFISGGDDPIVTTKNVLDASPDEGITMLSIAGLTHFLGEDARTEREIEQREFWLPEAARLIGRAAARAEQLHAEERKVAHREFLEAQSGGKPLGEESDAPAAAKRPQGRDLASPEFEQGLDWVIDGVTSKVVEGTTQKSEKPGQGWLVVCRNGLPAAFLGAEMHRAWGTGLHHHDVGIQRYAAGLAWRAKRLEELAGRLTVVLPPRLERTFVRANGELIDPHSDAPGWLTSEAERQRAWHDFVGEWGPHLRWLDAGMVGAELRGEESGLERKTFATAVGKWQGIPPTHLSVNHLPDVWVCLDNFRPSLDPNDPDRAVAALIGWVGGILQQETPVGKGSGGPVEPQSDEGKRLAEDLKKGLVRIVRVSGAELNPRYRGRIERSFGQALLLLAHCAAALARSRKQQPPPH